MLMAQFMVVLDVSVVNVALPSIGKSLSFSSGDYQWVVSAYVLLSGGLLLFGGRLSDLFDRRTMFLTGLTVFTTASLVSATASSAATMILSRAAQGTGAAMLTPAALSIIVTTYTGKQRSTALAIWGTIGSMGIAAGVLLGGILTTTLGWRSIFFVNVPIGIVAAVLTLRTVARNRNNGPTHGPRSLGVPGVCRTGHRTPRHGQPHRMPARRAAGRKCVCRRKAQTGSTATIVGIRRDAAIGRDRRWWRRRQRGCGDAAA